MINPHDITNYNRDVAELQAFLLFAISVAGKKSAEIAPKINSFCLNAVTVDDEQIPPFQYIKDLFAADLLEDVLRDHKLGKYEVLRRACFDILFLDLKSCTIKQLESCHGIGPKTARFFLLHSRPSQRCVVLDTHLLKWVRLNIDATAPKQTPTCPEKYLKWEKKVIDHLGDIDYAKFDLEVWTSYAK